MCETLLTSTGKKNPHLEEYQTAVNCTIILGTNKYVYNYNST